MADKITWLRCELLDTEDDENAIQPVAAELQQAIRDRIETPREDFVDIALIDRIGELHNFGGEHTSEMSI